MRNILIIDAFGQTYNGHTLQFHGLGGAESCVIHLARTLASLGEQVTVLNSCSHGHIIHDEVTYYDLGCADQIKIKPDIVISSRSVVPFMSLEERKDYTRNYALPDFEKIIGDAYRILWRHDTYVDGDNNIAEMVKSGKIDQVVTLSSWHHDHALKHLSVESKVIGNGVQYYPNTEEKVSLRFVYNAAAYKGLDTILTKVWPKIRETFPLAANLVVVGGHYKGIIDNNTDYMGNCMANPPDGVVFTGVVTPEEAAMWTASAEFFLHPVDFPETFGISAIEAIYYETLPIVVNKGAFRDTLPNTASVKVDNPEAYADVVLETVKKATLGRDNEITSKVQFLKSYSQAARHCFSWEYVVKTEWMKLFDKLEEKGREKNMKKILIAVPTAVRIECETFKSIYDLEIPEGYETEFHFFWCYMIDQGRNEIANYAIHHGFDYLLAVDSDIELPRDALKKMLAHDKDLVSGVYRMRRPEQVIELYDVNYQQVPADAIRNTTDLIEIGGCGFGCVLVKVNVLAEVGYPQFVYHQAYRFDQTFSEDNDFCMKARNKGFKLYCDPTIKCRHKGTVMWTIQ